MSKRIRGITIEIDGNVGPLGKALASVDKQTKDLQAELRDVDRLLKLDPKSTELLTQKKKLLADAVGASAERLATLKTAQEQAARAFAEGKIGEDQYRAIQREVIDATNKLGDMEKQLIEINNQFKRAGEQIGKFGEGISNAGAKMAPLSGVAAGAIAGIVGMAVNAGAAADDLNTLARQTGLTTETIQKFQHASGLVDVPLETLTGSLGKLTRTMGTAQEGNKQTSAAFEQLGITITDETGKLRDNEAVFHEVIAALGGMENETERNILAMALMGKSATDLNPLILGGADALKQIGEEAAAAGLILSQDTLDGLNQFNDVLDTTKAQLGATGAVIAAEFGAVLLPLIQDLAKWVQELATRFRALDEDTAKIILVVLAAVAALAPFLIILGKVVAAVGAITSAIGALTAAAAAAKLSVGAFIVVKALLLAKVIAVIAILAALVAGIVLLVRNFDTIRATVSTFVTDALARLGEMGTRAREIVASMRDSLVGIFANLVTRAREVLAGVVDAITAPFRRAQEAVSGIMSTVAAALQRINPFARSSPSLVDNVRAGVQAISAEYSKLERLALPAVAAMSVPTTGASATQAAAAHQGPLFTVQGMTVRSDNDIDTISRQLYRHIQTGMRARGGK